MQFGDTAPPSKIDVTFPMAHPEKRSGGLRTAIVQILSNRQLGPSHAELTDRARHAAFLGSRLLAAASGSPGLAPIPRTRTGRRISVCCNLTGGAAERSVPSHGARDSAGSAFRRKAWARSSRASRISAAFGYCSSLFCDSLHEPGPRRSREEPSFCSGNGSAGRGDQDCHSRALIPWENPPSAGF